MIVPPAQANPLGGLNLQFDPPVPWSAGWGPVFWAALAGVPVTIILFYFLKLRRKPVQVPSTFLWRKSIEDLHVNSLFQRLRRNLLLFLQLLAVLLMMFALLGPQMKGSTRVGQRYVIAIDNSASMSATDVRPSRLDEAKQRALALVDAMGPSDLAMVIAFADTARVASTYTGNKAQLRERINAIRPARTGTSLLEALQVAAGLANPSKQFGEGQVASEVQAPRLMVYTDGGFPDVEGFSLGNLVPEIVILGRPPSGEAASASRAGDGSSTPPSNNVAILALQTARGEDRPDVIQLFGRVRNYRDEPVETTARLFLHPLDEPIGDGRLIDAAELSLPAGGTQAFKFDLVDPGPSGLEVRLDLDDDLEQDDRAFAAVGRPRTARVLVVTEGNRYLLNALTTATAGEAAEVVEIRPADLETDEVRRALIAGLYDLVIFDRVAPEEPPAGNALYFGVMPPGEAFAEARPVEAPIILDWDIAHPMLQYLRDLPLVLIRDALVVDPPPGSTTLIESDKGPLAFVSPRDGYSDAVVGWSIYGEDRQLNTDWHTKLSYPVFLFNALRFLGNVEEALGEEVHRPGQPVVLRAGAGVDRITVSPPGGPEDEIPRSDLGTFVYNDADEPGLYLVSWPDGEREARSVFAVNLFDPRESDLSPRGIPPEGVSGRQAEPYLIKIGYTEIEGTRRSRPARLDRWWWVALGALGVVLFEWYIYNRRVYI
ncbi:VWA domain-containing protein [Tautonia sociabilis]|uniref:VWA domain-containing protein n=2 Tax=Tautonia sociabilis TaxID=2080755 RepID=A0A432MBU6_9BACT|nr:VWA domain-containing protein [Tautonia sociabilis]